MKMAAGTNFMGKELNLNFMYVTVKTSSAARSDHGVLRSINRGK